MQHSNTKKERLNGTQARVRHHRQTCTQVTTAGTTETLPDRTQTTTVDNREVFLWQPWAHLEVCTQDYKLAKAWVTARHKQ